MFISMSAAPVACIKDGMKRALYEGIPRYTLLGTLFLTNGLQPAEEHYYTEENPSLERSFWSENWYEKHFKKENSTFYTKPFYSEKPSSSETQDFSHEGLSFDYSLSSEEKSHWQESPSSGKFPTAEESYIKRLLRYEALTIISATPKCYAAEGEKSTLPRACGPQYATSHSFMYDVEDLLQHKCTLVDPLWQLGKRDVLSPDQNVDFVVVGAGTAGSIVAGRLSEDPHNWSVALLEAGGPYPTGAMVPGEYFSYAKPDSPINWNFLIEPQAHACRGYENRQCHFPRGMVLGGTGVLHGMMYMRGNPFDYDRWPGTANVSWTYESNLPYFKKSERNTQIGDIYEKKYHGTSGPVTISQFPDYPELAIHLLEAGRLMGYSVAGDLNGREQLGFTFAQATQNNGTRLSMYNSFIVPLLWKRTLHISPYTYVTKVLIHGNRAYGVEYYKNGHVRRVFANKEVIISAGSIQSPQILLLSGIGPKDHLKEMNVPVTKDLPQVGENLQNHVSYSVKFEVKEDCFKNSLNEASLYEFITANRGPLTSTGLSQVTGFIRVNHYHDTPKSVPDIQMFFEGYLANCSITDGNGCRNKKRYITMTPTLLRPKSRGTIKLRNSYPTDPPIINANYLSYEEERTLLVNGIKFALKMARTPALRNVLTLVQQPVSYCRDEFGSDKYWHCAIQYWNNPENHQIGTCSMGISEDSSVVDPTLKVHSIEGLRVIDASVMPHVISGNINGPIMMIAEKGADMIKEEWNPKNKQ